MNVSKKQIIGMTLLETMLVAAVAAAVALIGINQYQQYRFSSNIQGITNNVTALFQAASNYYQANCRMQTDSSGKPISGTGTLDPANSPPDIYPVPVSTLISQGYLTTNLMANPLVDTTAANGGYSVEFLAETPVPQTITLQNGSKVTLGSLYVWRVQVAVKLKKANDAPFYLKMLNGRCISTETMQGNTKVIITCEIMESYPETLINNTNWSAVPTYIAWEQMPSMVFNNSGSGLWPTNPMVNQFNQMYTRYPIMYVTGHPSAQSPGQNYLCGS